MIGFKYWIIFLFQLSILFDIRKTADYEPEYVRVGKYSDLQEIDVNLPECGLRYVTEYRNVSLNEKCFQYKYEERIIWDYESKPVSSRIYGGKEAEANEAPWAVYLNFEVLGSDTHKCTGSLITFEWILTAAHCLDVLSFAHTLTINAGSSHMDGDESIGVDQWFQHHFYKDPSLYRQMGYEATDETIKGIHDLALLKAKHKFTKHKNKDKRYLINTVCLPNRNWRNKRSLNATVFGWGKYNDDNVLGIPIGYPIILQKGQVEIGPINSCVRQSILCAKSEWNPNDPRNCRGDSGGPLVQYIPKPLPRAVLIGVTHGFSPPDAGCNNDVTGQYWAHIPSFIDWILETIKSH